MQKNKGFTLIELMITIAVLAIIATLAAPSFSQLTNKYKLEEDSRDLLSILMQARNDAILKRKVVTIFFDPSVASSETTFVWTPKNVSNIFSNVPTGYNFPPVIQFDMYGVAIPRKYTELEKNPSGVWVVKKQEVSPGVFENITSTHARYIEICSTVIHRSRRINYSVIGAFESISEGQC